MPQQIRFLYHEKSINFQLQAPSTRYVQFSSGETSSRRQQGRRPRVGVARRPPAGLLASLVATSLQPVWIMLGLEFAIKTKKRHALRLRVNTEM